MGLGDEIMAAGQAQVAYDADPSRLVAICGRNGKPRWSDMWLHNPVIATRADLERSVPVNYITNGEGCRPYIRYPFTASRGMRCTDWRARDYPGRIYLTEEERRRGLDVLDRVGPFVLIEPDVKPTSTPNKRWGLDRFRQVVDALPDVTFVRAHGLECDPFPGVLNIQTQDFRDACGILAAAQGYVGTEGGFHHAAAALGRPGVVIFGGFISPKTTGYPSHINICDKGPGSPCGKWQPCGHCEAAMARITVPMVVAAVERMLGRDEREQAS